MSNTKNKKNTATVKPAKVFVANGSDKHAIQLSSNSSVQPDFSLVIPAIDKVLGWLRINKMGVTPWHEAEMHLALNSMIHVQDPRCTIIIAEFEKSMAAEKPEQAFMLLDVFVRPQASLLHSATPAPRAFMQRGVLFVDKVSANLEQHITDPNFWWQPITDPLAYELSAILQRLKDRCDIGQGFDFLGIKNKTQL